MEISDWPQEAATFLEELGETALAAGFARRPRFAAIDASWCAALPVGGPLGTFELQLWTTPASAALGQVRLWTLRSVDGAIDLDRGRIATYLHDGIDEIAEHAEYVRRALELAENEPALAAAMRVASDPGQRDERVRFLRRYGFIRDGRNGAPS